MISSRIVIIEDNAADVLLVEDALKQHGLECAFQHFANGETAARAIAAMTEAPGLFVLDLNLPRVHGLELLRLIRASSVVGRTPVAILTSSRAATDKTKSEQLGADAYIIKPTGYTEFVDQVGLGIAALLRKSPGPSAWRTRRGCRTRSAVRLRRRSRSARQVFRKVPRSSSSNAWRSCSCVFITMGPYHATGS